MKTFLSFFVFSLIAVTNQTHAQDFRSDYKSGPVHYQPEDPWVRGKIFQVHTGHGGWFYNCDHQEDKRFSPYINWKRQPYCSGPDCPIACDIRQQLDEVKRRICWGQGDCCHRTDRLPPNPANATPYVETYSELEVYPNEVPVEIQPNSSVHSEFYSRRQPSDNGRVAQKNKNVLRAPNNRLPANTSRRARSAEDKYLVEDPTGRR